MNRLTLRLDDEDLEILEKSSKKLKKNKNELLRELIRKSEIEDIKTFNKNLKELLLLKRSLGNNLNQLAKNGHNIEKFEEVKKELEELWQSLKA